MKQEERERCITNKQFIAKLANRSGVKETTMKRILDNMFMIIVEELRMNRVCQVPRMFDIVVKEGGGYDTTGFDGQPMWMPVYTRVLPKSKPELRSYVVGKPVGHEAAKKRRKGVKTQSDKELEKLKFENKELAIDKIIADMMNKNDE